MSTEQTAQEVSEHDKPVIMNDDSYKNEAELDELFDDALEQGGEPVPMDELVKGVKTIQENLKLTDKNAQPKEEKTAWSDQVEGPESLDDLIKSASPTTPRLPPHMVEQSDKKEKRSNSMKVATNSSEYQESFASQRETSEMRSEIEGMSARMANLERTLETVLAERSTLPKHISTIREDMNTQLTLMMDKLNSTIESGITTNAAQNASQALVDASEEVGDQLHSLESHTTAPPRDKSIITNPQARLSGRRRFRPVE